MTRSKFVFCLLCCLSYAIKPDDIKIDLIGQYKTSNRSKNSFPGLPFSPNPPHIRARKIAELSHEISGAALIMTWLDYLISTWKQLQPTGIQPHSLFRDRNYDRYFHVTMDFEPTDPARRIFESQTAGYGILLGMQMVFETAPEDTPSPSTVPKPLWQAPGLRVTAHGASLGTIETSERTAIGDTDVAAMYPTEDEKIGKIVRLYGGQLLRMDIIVLGAAELIKLFLTDDPNSRVIEHFPNLKTIINTRPTTQGHTSKLVVCEDSDEHPLTLYMLMNLVRGSLSGPARLNKWENGSTLWYHRGASQPFGWYSWNRVDWRQEPEGPQPALGDDVCAHPPASPSLSRVSVTAVD